VRFSGPAHLPSKCQNSKSLRAFALFGFHGSQASRSCRRPPDSGGTQSTGTRERASSAKAVPCGPGVSAGALHAGHQNAGMVLRDRFHNCVGRIAVFDHAAHRKTPARLGRQTPSSVVAQDSEMPRPPPVRARATPAACDENLRQRIGCCHRGRRGLIAFHRQQHRTARGGTKLARIPIRRHRQHRTRRQPHQLLGDAPTITGPAPCMPLVPITISPASYCRATSTSICATAPWRISEWL
jgi:hypothetical protein